ncbi:sugar ABC transporter substrate-binding protein [Ensifer soli]|uniref:sugar ABC transporter substrate-binding protein n=1 Tax=Ciceribacter sp. sgz301302 TaxID=3342379 RepID=UPI0035BB39E4
MKRLLMGLTLAVSVMASGIAQAQETKTLGIVALIANDALNIEVIGGATEEAKKAGWEVKVIDTQASADQANAAMKSFATQGVDAIFVLAFASSSISSGLEAAKDAKIPVATWGGEIVDGIVVTTSGLTVGEDSVKYLLDTVKAPADILAITFHPGKLCLDRGVAFEQGVAGKEGLDITYNEVTVPGQVQNGNAIASAFLTGHPEGGNPVAIWSCWDEPMQGAVAALRQSARTDVTTVSINGSRQALQLVKDGDLTATVWQPAFEEGKAVFQAILESQAATGTWTPKVIEIPGVVVTKENVDSFLAEHPNAQ